MLSIFLYIIAFIMICSGVYLLFKMLSRERDTKAPSLDEDVHIDPNTSKPVIPRHARELLKDENLFVSSSDQQTQTLSMATTPPPVVVSSTIEPQTVAVPSEAPSQQMESHEEITLPLNPNIEVKPVEAFQGESELLIANLEEQDDIENDDEQVMEFYVYLDDSDLRGDRFLKILERYGLRFGEENYFHRYHQDEEGNFYHMFSLAKRTYEGTTEPFDINAMLNEPINAVVFFLTLPHYDAVMGYDMMMTSMHRMARELRGRIFDGHRNELTSQTEEDLRTAIKAYVNQ